MERSEPSLVPEWLKNAGSSVGGSTPSHSDDHASSRGARNKSFMNGNGSDFGRSSSSERTTSSYFRRSSSSNSSGHFRSHNNIGRHKHDKDWDKEFFDSRDLDKSFFGDRRHHDLSDSLGNPSLGKYEKDGLKRSQSMISGKQGGSWNNRFLTETSNASRKNTNGFLTKGSSVGGMSKTNFEKDFPLLGPEERATTPEIGRVPSPGLSSAIQSLPIGSSSSLGNEKWTSALAEVPAILGSNGTVLPTGQQATPPSSMSVTLSSNASLNMAEAVAQGPIRIQTASQLSVGTQRLEELAIKQSRQLIPVKPSLPKTLVSNSSDKQKGKVAQPSQPVSPLSANHSPRNGLIKADVSKGSNAGKLHVLKPPREKNGVIPVGKDNLSPNGSKPASSTLAAAPSISGSAATRSLPANVVLERKASLTMLDKRPISQAQSRHDFFNLVRKKSLANFSSSVESAPTNSTSPRDAYTSISPSYSDEKHSEIKAELATDTPEPVDEPLQFSNDLSKDKSDSTCNGDPCVGQQYASNGRHHPYIPIISEEEEFAFLLSLGWEENTQEECLTKDEIVCFLRNIPKYISSNPSSLCAMNLIRLQQNFMLTLD